MIPRRLLSFWHRHYAALSTVARFIDSRAQAFDAAAALFYGRRRSLLGRVRNVAR